MEFAEAQATEVGLTRLGLYTNVVMTENQAIYAHLGYRETARQTENGYHRVFMEKDLEGRRPYSSLVRGAPTCWQMLARTWGRGRARLFCQ